MVNKKRRPDDDTPERRQSVIDAPKQLAIPRVVASPQSHTPFRQPTPEYSVDSPNSTLHRTLKPHASKNPTSLSIHCTKIEFENLFSNLPLTLFKTVADTFVLPERAILTVHPEGVATSGYLPQKCSTEPNSDTRGPGQKTCSKRHQIDYIVGRFSSHSSTRRSMPTEAVSLTFNRIDKLVVNAEFSSGFMESI